MSFSAYQSADAEDFSFHIHKFVLEAKDKPFSLMLDSDFENIIENVLRWVHSASPNVRANSRDGCLERLYCMCDFSWWCKFLLSLERQLNGRVDWELRSCHDN